MGTKFRLRLHFGFRNGALDVTEDEAPQLFEAYHAFLRSEAGSEQELALYCELRGLAESYLKQRGRAAAVFNVTTAP